MIKLTNVMGRVAAGMMVFVLALAIGVCGLALSKPLWAADEDAKVVVTMAGLEPVYFTYLQEAFDYANGLENVTAEHLPTVQLLAEGVRGSEAYDYLQRSALNGIFDLNGHYFRDVVAPIKLIDSNPTAPHKWTYDDYGGTYEIDTDFYPEEYYLPFFGGCCNGFDVVANPFGVDQEINGGTIFYGVSGSTPGLKVVMNRGTLISIVFNYDRDNGYAVNFLADDCAFTMNGGVINGRINLKYKSIWSGMTPSEDDSNINTNNRLIVNGGAIYMGNEDSEMIIFAQEENLSINIDPVYNEAGTKIIGYKGPNLPVAWEQEPAQEPEPGTDDAAQSVGEDDKKKKQSHLGAVLAGGLIGVALVAGVAVACKIKRK